MIFRYLSILCAGWLALAINSTADIIWSGEQNLSGYEQNIDLNSDALIDAILVYQITANNTIIPTAYSGFLDALVDGVNIDGSNRILVDPSTGLEATLPFGSLIAGTPAPPYEWEGGTGWYFAGRVSEWSTLPPDSDTEWRGLLGENGNTYIGISFDVEGATHYAWVNIALGPEGPHGFEMPITTSWAYESTPDTPIVAGAIPEPSTGILTMLGSLGLIQLARSRHRRQQSHAPKKRGHRAKVIPITKT